MHLENLTHKINNFTTKHEFRVIKAPQNRHNHKLDIRRFTIIIIGKKQAPLQRVLPLPFTTS